MFGGMETFLAPGYERLLLRHPWFWTFGVSGVREGHDCVSVSERSGAKKIGAKLTFGEVLESGVLLMLKNLGAFDCQVLHDLGCGAGKMIIQSFLHCNNLTRCLGIELAPGRYNLAERNMHHLIQNGWQGRHFLTVEYKENEFFKIVECVQNKTLSVGMPVVCFHTTLRPSKHIFPDYNAVLLEISGPLCSVKFNDGRILNDVQLEFVFSPENVRTLEIYAGNIFHHPTAWDCEVCILETDFPSETHAELLKCMATTPIGCKFLTYHDLKQFSQYSNEDFRQLDMNVYDSDRYPTSWSQGWRFYTWEHIKNQTTKIEPYEIQHLQDMKFVTVSRHGKSSVVRIAKVKKHEQCLVGTHVGGPQNPNPTIHQFNPLYDNIYSLTSRFDIGDLVCSYWPHNVHNDVPSQFELFFARIDGVGSRGYTVLFDDGDIAHDVNPCWVFKRPQFMFAVGQRVDSCWPGNAQNKNCPERYRRYPATIRSRNSDGTYGVEFFSGIRANHVREMWLLSISENEFHEKSGTTELPPDPAKAVTWSAQTVHRWVELLGVSSNCVEAFQRNQIDGTKLLQLTQDDLHELNLTKKEVQLIGNKIYRLKVK